VLLDRTADTASVARLEQGNLSNVKAVGEGVLENRIDMAHPQSSAVRNRLLAALPADVLNQLLPKLHRVSLTMRKSLATPQTPIEAVYFVESGWVSMVADLDEGAQAEVGIIGREGKKVSSATPLSPGWIPLSQRPLCKPLARLCR
jgi:hypothetical protein